MHLANIFSFGKRRMPSGKDGMGRRGGAGQGYIWWFKGHSSYEECVWFEMLIQSLSYSFFFTVII